MSPEEWLVALQPYASRQNSARLRIIGRGVKRHPETTDLFDTLADFLDDITPLEERDE
jgi:hypothetical protein